MQFGLFGGARTKRSAGIEDSQGYESFIDYVIEADRLGFKQLFMVEHHFTGQGQVSASMTLLAYLAAQDPEHPSRHGGRRAALAQSGADGRAGRHARPPERRPRSISASARATARPSSTASAFRSPRRPSASTRRWRSSARRGPREGRFSHHGKRWHYDNIVVEPEPLQRPHPPLWLAAGSHDSVRRAAREGYNLLLDQLAQIDQIIQRIAHLPRGMREDRPRLRPAAWWRRRAPLQMIHSESEREQAYETRKRVVTMIGDLARDKLADRVEDDTAPLLGTPDEVIARLKQLEAGGATNILLVDPNASVANLRAFAREVMPAFRPARAVAAAE